MDQKAINELISITIPFAKSAVHVQGPGGNTSVKCGKDLFIKASGFTFSDVADCNGIVSINNDLITKNIHRSLESGNLENAHPEINESMPEGLKPSMEFEFHSLLGKYVLHTHSVYVNAIMCSKECNELLKELFEQGEYLLLPYVTPGFPIAAELLKHSPGLPSIIFLKNHGIIIHGETSNHVIETYNYVENRIREKYGIQQFENGVLPNFKEENLCVNVKDIFSHEIKSDEILQIITERILIPDQSIFFRNKISGNRNVGSPIFLDDQAGIFEISGSEKYIDAAVSMLQAVGFINRIIAEKEWHPEFIPTEKVDIIHGLSTEKYRLSILKN